MTCGTKYPGTTHG